MVSIVSSVRVCEFAYGRFPSRESVGGSCTSSFGNVSSDRVECVLGDS